MAEQSKIEWTDHTFNPWEGCQKVAPECDNCYAEARDVRFTGGTHWGPKAPRRRTSAQNWQKPRKWNAQAEAFHATHGRRQRVFCASLADVFDNAVDFKGKLKVIGSRFPDSVLKETATKRVGKAGAGRSLDGQEWNEVPNGCL
jgi:protein gp37